MSMIFLPDVPIHIIYVWPKVPIHKVCLWKGLVIDWAEKKIFVNGTGKTFKEICSAIGCKISNIENMDNMFKNRVHLYVDLCKKYNIQSSFYEILLQEFKNIK
jgi:hypothetical protein